MRARTSTGRVYRSKNRRINTCLECHRRKQKCDRRQPCNICVNRDSPEKCVYGNIGTSLYMLPDQPASRAPGTELRPSIDQSHLSVLSSEIGYFNQGHSPHLIAPNITTISGLKSQSPQNLPVPISNAIPDSAAALLDLLPAPETAHKLVHVFFHEANWYFSVIDKCFFVRRFRNWLISTRSRDQNLVSAEDQYFPALLFQVLAIGLQFVPKAAKLEPDMLRLERKGFESHSREFSEAGESMLTCYRRREPNMSSVEADIMRCAWLKNNGLGSEAWHSLSSAIRQAQDIGLHLEPVVPPNETGSSENLLLAWDREHRRRVWACLATWDAHMSLQLGRPRMINLADCTVQRPINCDAPLHTARTMVRVATSDDEPPSLYTSHILKYDIAMRIHQALDAGLLRPSTSASEKVRKLDAEIRDLLENLPSAFHYSDPDTSWDLLYPDIPKLRLQIRIIVDAFLLALHRPHLTTDTVSMHAATHAAISILTLSEDFFDMLQEHQYKTFTSVFYIIDAGIFLAATLTKFETMGNNNELYSRESMINILLRALSRLDILKEHHTAAVVGQAVLRDCLRQLHPDPPSTPIQPRPVSFLAPDPPFMQQPQLQAAPTLDFDVDDDFLGNLLKDSAATFTWLENQWNLAGGTVNHSEPLL